MKGGGWGGGSFSPDGLGGGGGGGALGMSMLCVVYHTKTTNTLVNKNIHVHKDGQMYLPFGTVG